MGNTVMKASHWSRKSLFSVYGKTITLLFAFFCIASGQTMRAAPANGSVAGIVKGRALFASDSTPLSDIKLYFGNIAIPVYGMSAVPYVQKKDSAYTDKEGNFATSSAVASWSHVIAEIAETGSSGKPVLYISTTAYYLKGNDTVITAYMKPLQMTGVEKQSAEITSPPLHIIRGKTVTVRIPEWTRGAVRAFVTNSKGEIVARPRASATGDIRWHAESVAKGIYFINISNGKNRIAVKCAIR